MKEIQNKEQVLERLKKLVKRSEFSFCCDFCGTSMNEYAVHDKLIEFGDQPFIQFYCRRCGHSMFLNYNVLMKMD